MAAFVGTAGLIEPCAAAMMSYPDKGPVQGVMFTNIVEASTTDPLPLFGEPSVFNVGLDFDPTPLFGSSALNGAADMTDGRVDFTVMGAIDSLSIFERGDYTLLGSGDAGTSAFMGATINATVMEINGTTVVPIVLPQSAASLSFNLAANAGFLQPWSFNLTLDIASELASLGYGPNEHATKIQVAVRNQLVTMSQVGTAAFIDKSEFIVTVDPSIPIPEPGAPLLAGLAMCGIGVFACTLRRRRLAPVTLAVRR